MTEADRAAYKRRVSDVVLRHALELVLVRLGSASDTMSVREIRDIETSVVRNLRRIAPPKGMELETATATEDAIIVIKGAVANAERRLAQPAAESRPQIRSVA